MRLRPIGPRRLLALTLSFAALALPACGGDDEGDPTSGTSGTSGAQGAATDVSAIDMTAKEFNDATIPDEVATVDKLAAANPDCADQNIKSDSFRQGVFIAAVQADAETMMSELVADQCAGG